MKTDKLLKIINDLTLEREKVEYDFLVRDYPEFENHKIGLDKQGNICLLIKSKDDSNKPKSKLDSYKHIRILFDRSCEIIPSQTKKVINSNYTVIQFFDSDNDVQIYFLHVCSIIIRRLGNYPSLNNTYASIKYLLELFSKILSPAKNSIQGIWTELFLIDLSSDVDYMINAWHVQKNDRFDFNDGNTKLEVKSTNKSERIHRFSFHQLKPNKNSGLFIASVMVMESGLGISIFDLIKSIESKTTNSKCIEKLYEIVFETLGNLTTKILSVKYDKLYSVDKVQYFNFKDIPVIDKECIPANITNIKFDINLENILPIQKLSNKLIS